MKTMLLTLCLVMLLTVHLVAEPPQGVNFKPSTPASPLAVDNTSYINVNNMLMFVTNHGNFGRDLSGVFGYDFGTFYPYVSVQQIEDGSLAKSVVYASGLWIGALDSATNQIRVAVAEYEDEYVPGPMVGGLPQPDIPRYKIYKLYKDSLADNPNSDYLNWPYQDGAPWKIDTLSGDTVPDMVGDQMLWAVFNDADSAQHGNDAGKTLPLGIEVRQTTFGYNRTDPLGNVIFVRLRVYNKGGNTLQNCYFSLWADPDLGGFTDDLVGCDTTLSIGFCYNGDNDDTQFGRNPPSVGYDFFQGPLIQTGNATDTARMWGQLYAGYVNLGMGSFNKYINGTDPDNFQETYNYMNGLNRNGTQYTYNGVPTKYFVSGDPVTGTGDLDVVPADRRFMLSTGPVTFRPGDSTEILAAIIVGRATDRLSSIAFMKYNDKFAQDAYESFFIVPEPPVSPEVTVAVNDNRVSLHWTDTSEVYPGTYNFEGYTLYQSDSSTGPWTYINNYDIVNSIQNIYDEVPDPLTGAVEMRLVKRGKNLGLIHDIVLKEDYVLGGPLRNMKTYWYKLEAYSYNPAATVAKTLTSQSIFSAVPQSPVAGTRYEYNFADTVDVTHIGNSDGGIYPFVLNSKLFETETYEVRFYDTVDIHIDTIYDPAYPGDPDYATFVHYNSAWNWINTGTGDTVVSWQYDQSGVPTYLEIPGLELVVAGPPLEGRAADYAGAVPADISPVAQAEYPDYEGGQWFTGAGDGELLSGGVYLAPNFDLTTLTPADYKIVEVQFRPMESYTDLTGNGMYTPGEPYVAMTGANDQNAFMYQSWDNSTYEGFFPIPFTAWDMTDPNNPRQLNVVIRDRDGNHQWDLDYVEADSLAATLLPNGGDLQYNYAWILNTDYDPTGTMYGDGNGNIGFMDEESDAMWVLWLTDAEDGGMLAELGALKLTPYNVNTPADTFRFTTNDTLKVSGEQALEAINVVPNPFYLYGPYDPTPGNYKVRFQHLPIECGIHIFNLGGQLIEKMYKNSDISYVDWDLKTSNGLPVASGIYIYVVDAPGYGTKIGKMAIFTEVEVLKTY